MNYLAEDNQLNKEEWERVLEKDREDVGTESENTED